MCATEIFKDIPKFENRYQVSNKGRIKSLGNEYKRKEKILKSSLNSRGYLTVHLNSKTYQVHQLVAMAFLNHIPNGYVKIVDHIDNLKTNNNVNNLRLISQRENISKKFNKEAGIRKNKNNWNLTLTFCSIKSEEEAIMLKKKLILYFEEINRK